MSKTQILITSKWAVLSIICLTILAGCGMQSAPVVVNEVSCPLELMDNFDLERFNEPSGVVFHPNRKTLFVVGDEGDIGEFRTDGSPVKQQLVRRADFEGITCNPSSGLLYVAIEGEEKILEIHPEDFRVIREFTIERVFGDEVLLSPGGQGLEAIAFVPDTKGTQSGTFYLANRDWETGARKNASVLVEVEVPLGDDSIETQPAKIIRYFRLDVNDLSGLHYNASAGHLYAISDSANTFLELTLEGKILQSCDLPGKDQEGITADENGILYAAQDSGGLIKVK